MANIALNDTATRPNMALTPMKENHPNDDGSEGITVAIRMRPLNNAEGSSKERIWKVLPKYSSVTQTTRDGKPLSERVTGRTFFTFDKTFGEDTNNTEVYDGVAKGIVTSVVQGLNGTIFAYGQTSSGKTYTMQGSGNLQHGSMADGEGGLIHLAADDIFSQIAEQRDRLFLVRVSFLEIYNEEVRDLLAESKNHTLQIREDPRRGVFVHSEEEIVTDFESLLSILVRGDRSRTFAATGMNERSSRSHTILRITIESREKDFGDDTTGESEDRSASGDGAVRVSTLNLVDLAGSESVRHTGATGERQKEGGLINQSLLTLSRVIVALGTPNQMHINFRDSKLTRILQPSLSGNARMAVICCATASELYLEETRSTLQFASRAKLVKTNAQVNEVLDERSMIRRLQRELAEAKRKHSGLGNEQVRDLEKQVETAGSQAMEAQAKLDRLKASFLNSGYIFDQGLSEHTHNLTVDLVRVSNKRRKSEGSLLVGCRTPSMRSKDKVQSPKTAPRQKRTQTLHRPSLPAEQELDIVQRALETRNQFIRELNDKIKLYEDQIKVKNDEIEKSNCSLIRQKATTLEEVKNLRETVTSMQATFESVVVENEKTVLEKEAEITASFENLRKSLGEKYALEEKLIDLQKQFSDVQEERVRSAFDLAEITTERKKLLRERAEDRITLQEMAGKAEFLTSNLNNTSHERDQAFLEIQKLRDEIDAKNQEYVQAQKRHKAEVTELEEQVDVLTTDNRKVRDQNEILQTQLSCASHEIPTLKNHILSLEHKLAENNEKFQSERESMETTINAASSEIERMVSDQENFQQLIKKLQETSDQSQRIIAVLSGEKKEFIVKLASMEEQLALSKSDIESSQHKQKVLEQVNQNLEDKLRGVDHDMKTLRTTHDSSLRDTAMAIESLQSSVSKTKKDLENALSEREEILDNVLELTETVKNLEISKRMLQDSLHTLEMDKTKNVENVQVIADRLQSLSDERDVVIAEKNSMEAVLKSYEKTVEDVEGMLASAEGQIARLQKERDAAVAASGQSLTKIHELLRDLKMEQHKVSELESTKNVLESLCENREATIKAMNSGVADYERSLLSAREEARQTFCLLQEKKTDLSTLKKQCQQTGSQLEDALAEVHRLRDTNKATDVELKELWDEQHKTTQKLDIMEQERDALQSALNRLEESNSSYKSEAAQKHYLAEQLQDAKEKLGVELQALSSDIVVRDREIERLQSIVVQITEDKDQLMARQEELKSVVELLTSANKEANENLTARELDFEKKARELMSQKQELDEILVKYRESEWLVASIRQKNEDANDELIALQDQSNVVLIQATVIQARYVELNELCDTFRVDLKSAEEAVYHMEQELVDTNKAREAIVQSLRECEIQRDEATSEMQKLYAENRDLSASISLFLSKENEERLREELSGLKVQNVDLTQFLASLNDSEKRLREKMVVMENDLRMKDQELEDTKIYLSQVERELSRVKINENELSHSERSNDGSIHRIETLQREKQDIESIFKEEKERWRIREEDMKKQMGEEQRALIQEGEIVMTDLRRKLGEYERRLNQAESEAYTARQQVEESSDEQKVLEERFLEVSGQLSSLNGVNTYQKCQISELQLELSKTKSECYTLKESVIDMKEKMRRSARDCEKAIRESELAAKEVVSLRTKVSGLEKQIESNLSEIASLRKRVEASHNSENQINELLREVEKKEHKNDALNKELMDLEREKDTLSAELTILKLYKLNAQGEHDQMAQDIQNMTRLKEELKQKDQRIKKLETVRMTKDQIAKIKKMKMANEDLEKRFVVLKNDNFRLQSQISAIGSHTALRTEVSELRFDKEALERKLRKFATHCQRLEDDKAGIADALRSCNIDIETFDSDVSEAIIHLCDRLTSVEEAPAKRSLAGETKDTTLKKENEALREKVDKLSEKLNTYRIETNELRRHMQITTSKAETGRAAEELERKLGYLEQENLQLMQDLKSTKKQLQNTRAELESLRFNVEENPTIDFASLGMQTSCASSSNSVLQNVGTEASNTVELTELARTFSPHQESIPKRETRSSRTTSVAKKRGILSDTTSQSENQSSIEETTAVKRQRFAETKASTRQQRTAKTTPGLGESSSVENSESTGECKQS